jgi:hypothetical protein
MTEQPYQFYCMGSPRGSDDSEKKLRIYILIRLTLYYIRKILKLYFYACVYNIYIYVCIYVCVYLKIFYNMCRAL